jgi:biopolymer transport protein ExbD
MRTLSHAHVAGESHGIDLAPMLDFVVNLLIFFIITAVFVKQGGLEVRRPSSDSEHNNPSKSIVIDERGEVAIDRKAIDVRAVRAHIEQLKAVDPKAGIVIIADERAPTGAVVAVADQIRLAGISDITFTTTPLAKPQ